MTAPPDLPGSSSSSEPPGRRRTWLLGLCLPLALACAFIPAASLHGQSAPGWLVAVAAMVIFPVLPLLWHLAAEPSRVGRFSLETGALERLSVRALAVALLVLVVSLSNLGPRQVGRSLLALARPGAAPAGPAPATTAQPRPAAGSPAPARHELEPFIPADARSVLALSDARVLRQLLGSAGDGTRDQLAALEKCQILMDQARVLIAARSADARLIVLRAPGVTDPRNLYCLAGVLGSDRLRLRFTSDKPPIRFEVEGLYPQTLRFTAIDERTVMAIDGPWGPTVDRKLFPPGADSGDGPLLPVLDRVDRGASLWTAGVFQTAEGAWDLATDARIEGGQLRLRASSIPASDPANQAVIETSVPVAFFSALPAGPLRDGLQALLGALAAPAAGPAASAPQASPPAHAPAGKP